MSISRARLNTLAVGSHTLVVTLQGAFAGRTVTGEIIVAPAPVVPKTGDNTPLALLMLLTLLPCGGMALLLTRRRKLTNP